MRAITTFLLFALAAGVSTRAWALEPPSPGSPGAADEILAVAGSCPTFSWADHEPSRSYELVVYSLADGDHLDRPVLRTVLPRALRSWTPALKECLERGTSFAWSMRAHREGGFSQWSEPRLFEVSPFPTEAEFRAALELLERHYGTVDLPRPAGPPLGAAATPPLPTRSSGRAAPRMAMSGDSALQVNGSPVVTFDTFGGALCAASEVRFLDQGDGTVLDCNTGLIWLKDASCLGSDTWSDDGDGTTIFTRVSDLNSGLDLGCEDYVAGTYADWRVPEMTDLCGGWDGSCEGTPCCTAGEGMVDTTYSSPTVANAAGDGQWAVEDAFTGLGPMSVWSATELPLTEAWRVSLISGHAVPDSKKFEAFNVWPVRGGQ